MEAVKTSEGTFFLPHKHGTQAGGRIKRKIYSSSALATIASMGGRKKRERKARGRNKEEKELGHFISPHRDSTSSNCFSI
jgi:hypothetical protein